MRDRPPRSRHGRDRGPGPKIRILGPRDNGRTLPSGGKSKFIHMYYAYVLKSLSHGNFYIGSSGDPERRLNEEHNKGKVRYTKGRQPWFMLYKECYSTRSEAMKREKFLKTGQGRKELNQILSRAAGSSNGRTSPSGGEYLGSSPSPAALDEI